MSNIDKQARKEAIINRLASSFEPGSITDKQVDALSDTVDLINDLFTCAEGAEKRNARALSLLNSANTENVWEIIGRLKTVISGDYRSEDEIAAAACKGE